MSEPPRWSISEIYARYELEPHLKDIFVEGAFDREVLTRHFRDHDQTDRVIYEIDTIDVPDDLLDEYGYTKGNKQRVIALAHQLSTLPLDSKYRCLVDKDMEGWIIDDYVLPPRLIKTPYTSIDLYFFSDDLLKDILILTSQSAIKNWELYKSTLITTLRSFFCIRLADRALNWNMTLVSTDKYLKIKGSEIEFELDRYINNLLNSNSKGKEKTVFLDRFTHWNSTLTGDPRHYIHGHDFTSLLAWSVLKFKGIKEFSSQIAIERLFVMLAAHADGILDSFEYE